MHGSNRNLIKSFTKLEVEIEHVCNKTFCFMFQKCCKINWWWLQTCSVEQPKRGWNKWTIVQRNVVAFTEHTKLWDNTIKIRDLWPRTKSYSDRVQPGNVLARQSLPRISEKRGVFPPEILRPERRFTTSEDYNCKKCTTTFRKRDKSVHHRELFPEPPRTLARSICTHISILTWKMTIAQRRTRFASSAIVRGCRVFLCLRNKGPAIGKIVTINVPSLFTTCSSARRTPYFTTAFKNVCRRRPEHKFEAVKAKVRF